MNRLEMMTDEDLVVLYAKGNNKVITLLLMFC